MDNNSTHLAVWSASYSALLHSQNSVASTNYHAQINVVATVIASEVNVTVRINGSDKIVEPAQVSFITKPVSLNVPQGTMQTHPTALPVRHNVLYVIRKQTVSTVQLDFWHFLFHQIIILL